MRIPGAASEVVLALRDKFINSESRAPSPTKLTNLGAHQSPIEVSFGEAEALLRFPNFEILKAEHCRICLAPGVCSAGFSPHQKAFCGLKPALRTIKRTLNRYGSRPA